MRQTQQSSIPRHVREAGYDGYADFRVNGKASSQTQVNLDGGSNVDHGNDTKTTVTPSLESIQKVVVLTNNFQAEYGIRAGVVVNMVTKSGTNNFFNCESLKQDSPVLTNQIRVPTLLERQGDFSQTVNADGTRPTIYLPGTQASGAGVRENGLADQVDYRQTSLAALTDTTVRRLSPRNFGALDESSNKVPTVCDYSLSIQRQLPFGLVLDLAYIGNIQRHQPLTFNINQVLPGTAWKPEFIDPRLSGNNFYGPVSASNSNPLPGARAITPFRKRPFDQ